MRPQLRQSSNDTKKWFLILAVLFVFVFTGCQQATGASTKESTVKGSSDFYVKNSVWDNVDLTTLPQYTNRTVSRSIGGVSDLELAQGIVAEYNAENNDDQLVILTEDIPIEESPDVTIYFVKAVDGYYEIHSTYHDKRSFYKQYKQETEQDAAQFGCIVFIDKVPETAPLPVIDTRTDYEKYSVYLILDSDGSILSADHCSEDDWASNGYKSLDVYFTQILYSYESEARAEGAGHSVVYGQIYTQPVQ